MDDESYIIHEEVSEGEKRFELYRKTVSLFLGPLAFIFIYLMPQGPLSVEAHKLAAVLALVLVYWIGEPVPIPVTALLGPVLCVITGAGKAAGVFAPFAHPIIFLFIGSFILAEAMKSHRLDYRVSLAMLALPWIKGSRLRFAFALAALPAALSMWISDSATTAMMYPITLGIIGVVSRLDGGVRRDYSTGLLLTISYAALIGGIGTPVGTPPNLIGVGMIEKLAGVKILFFQWMVLAFPILIVMLGVMVGYVYLIHKAPSNGLEGLQDHIMERRSGLGPWTRGQKAALFAFVTAVTLWVLPGITAAVSGTSSWLYKFMEAHLREEIASLIAALMLFVIPIDWKERRFAISWQEASKIDWGTIILFGGGLSLGSLMFSTGLADFIGTWLIQATGADTLWTVTALAIGTAILMTEVTSNTATANMLVPLMISISLKAGISPAPPAIGVCLGASMAFMLPVSTPSNAIVYGSGMVPISKMVRAGLVMDIVSFFVILAGLRLLCPLLGLA